MIINFKNIIWEENMLKKTIQSIKLLPPLPQITINFQNFRKLRNEVLLPLSLQESEKIL
jgi:hypothetical protein